MAFALSLNGAQAGIFTSNNGLLEIGDEAFAVRFPPCCSRSLRAVSHPTTVITLQHNIRTLHTIICNTIISTLHKLNPNPETHYHYHSH